MEHELQQNDAGSLPARHEFKDGVLRLLILTFIAGLEASGDHEPEPLDREDYPVPRVHELVLHFGGPLLALLPPLPAPGNPHGCRP